MASTGCTRIIAPISAGELIDKIAILEIKAARLSGPDQLTNITRELDQLRAIRVEAGLDGDAVRALENELQSANGELWDIEAGLRDCEARGDFGERFVELARAVYRINDRRAAIKRRINDASGSEIVEEKSYGPA